MLLYLFFADEVERELSTLAVHQWEVGHVTVT